MSLFDRLICFKLFVAYRYVTEGVSPLSRTGGGN